MNNTYIIYTSHKHVHKVFILYTYITMDLKEKKEKLTSLLQFVEKTEAKERQNLNLLAQKKLEIKAQLSLIEEILSTKSAPTA